MLAWQLFRLDHTRRALASAAGDSALGRFYADPFPDLGAPVASLDYCALDFETTGLDAGEHAVVSFGAVSMQGLRIDLRSTRHATVLTERTLPDSAVAIHGITHDRVAAGMALREAVEAILAALRGRVLIAHHAAMECSFLDAACRRLFGVPFRCPTIDTEVLGARWCERRGETPPAGALRLSRLRERFGLPRYKAHDALVDALATAELFAAIVAWNNGRNTPARRYVSRT